MKEDEKEIFWDLRKADFRYEFGVYDEDGHYAPWRPALVDNTAYMYFGGNFMNIKKRDGFATDKIVIMKVVE